PRREGGLLPEAHGAPPPARGRPRVAGRADARLPDPRPARDAALAREGHARPERARHGLAPAARALSRGRAPPRAPAAGGRCARRAGGSRRRAARAVRGARARVHARDARLGARPASHRRRVGQALVRRGREVDRLRALAPARGRAPGPAARGARTMPRRLPLARGAAPDRLDSASMLQSYDPRNADLLVNIDGALVHRDQARISPFDSAVQGGDAVWEGLRLYGGRIFRLNEH